MRVSLEDATKLITGNQEALQYTALQMLEQLKLNDINEVGIVNDLINNTGTMVHTATMSAFTNTLNAPDGLVSQASRVYETLNTKSDEIGTILADNRVALDTWLNTVYTSSEANAANTVNSINASGVAVNNQIKTIYDQLKVDQNNRLSKITAKADDIYNKSAQLINSIDAGAPKVSDIREINNYINGEGGKIASLGPKIQYTTAAVQNVGTSVNLIGNKLDTANSLLASFIKAAGQKKEAEAAAAAAKKAADDAAKKAAADAQKKKIEDAIRAQMNSYVNDMKKKLGISDSATKQYEQVRDRAKKLDEMIRNYDSKQTNSAKRIGVYMSNYSNLSDYLNALGRMSPGAIADAQVRSQFEYLTKDLNVNEIRRYEQDLGKINEGVAALQNIFDGVIAKVWTGEIKDATAGIDSIKKQIQSLLYGDVRGNGGLLRGNGTTVYQFYDIHEDSKDDKKTNYYQGYTTSPYMTGAYASGTRRVSHSELAWTQEDGPELILRPSDGAVLTPLKMNDAVVPANFTDNLFKWGAINPDSFAVNPFMGKWGETAGGSDATDVYSNTNNQAVTLNIGSMFQIEGNVDSGVVDRLEDIAKQLTSNKDFQKNVINFVTKNYVKESRKQGFR